MWLDYANNTLVETQDKIVIDQSAKVVNLVGWAIDPQAGNTASNVYVKVGAKYYLGTYGILRTSVSDHFKNPNLARAGFTFTINAEDLIREGKFDFIVISKDKTYQYAPVGVKVEVRKK
jgi:hypothetical protein